MHHIFIPSQGHAGVELSRCDCTRVPLPVHGCNAGDPPEAAPEGAPHSLQLAFRSVVAKQKSPFSNFRNYACFSCDIGDSGRVIHRDSCTALPSELVKQKQSSLLTVENDIICHSGNGIRRQ
ncbi:unnamed protein product [Heligmosomoides polygyrus]|uniref:Nanos-type domain-containing protein n=1 Tax=Heligmosomoides polygyrus TaxID=6339 RepID=A0A183FZJ3_HELPZ|nr:unnamed protein product [Heligmosomoides polygyrus]